MLNKPITLDDMQSVVSWTLQYYTKEIHVAQLLYCCNSHPQDVDLWNCLTYILENDPEPLCLNFSVNKTLFGEVCYTMLYIVVIIVFTWLSGDWGGPEA